MLSRLRELPQLPAGQGRVEAIDLARGLAISLMILSHAVSGLLGIRRCLPSCCSAWAGPW
ncbi:hypothetical protein [Halomonas sp.]|jgi:uncharacterized membrane protein|uniref:hypothetical protein n=1 Tax=Halomonas sp. TaxID=1486246 RepID=UPI003562C4F5